MKSTVFFSCPWRDRPPQKTPRYLALSNCPALRPVAIRCSARRQPSSGSARRRLAQHLQLGDDPPAHVQSGLDGFPNPL